MKNQWTTSHIPNLSGKTMIVTEGDSTLGYETVKAFAMNGGETILACKNLLMGERIKAEIVKLHADVKIEVMSLDLRNPNSIQQFGKAFNQKYEKLDVLMNIGESSTISKSELAKYFGKQFGSDQAGHVVLTDLLLNKLASTPNSRVVNQSLGEHKLTAKDYNRLISNNGHRNSQKQKIGSSKWTNLVFTYELQKRFDTQKVSCTAVSAYPGPANRNLERRLRNHWSWRVFKPIYKMFTGPDSMESALPGIKAALVGTVKGGEYFGPNGIVEENGYPSYNAVLHFVA